MGTFNSAIGRMLNRVYAGFGEAAVYTDRLGTSTPCTVLVERDLTAYGDVATVGVRTAVVAVRVSELPDAPRRGDRFTLVATGKVLVVDSLQGAEEFENRVFAA